MSILRILQLTLSFRPGGRREAIATLARQLARQDIGCDLACVEELGCDEEVVAGLFRSQTVLRGGPDSPVKQLRSFCREREIDVIHCHDAASQFVAARAKVLRRRPQILMTFHRTLGFESARLHDKVRNALASLACSAIVVGSRERGSHFTRENYVSAKKVVRIPFGVDTNRFHRNIAHRAAARQELGLQPDQVLIGMAGHYGEEKGVDVALRAFRQLREQSPELDAHLAVLGTGTPERQYLMRSLAGEQVHLLGFRTDAPRWFSAFDVFFHAPRQEAFGLVIAEAMAAGLPVVATRVGGVPDLVRDEQTGFLAESEDTDSLAKSLQRLAGNVNLRQEFGVRGRETALSEYSQEEYGRRYVALYEQILARHRVAV